MEHADRGTDPAASLAKLPPLESFALRILIQQYLTNERQGMSPVLPTRFEIHMNPFYSHRCRPFALRAENEEGAFDELG